MALLLNTAQIRLLVGPLLDFARLGRLSVYARAFGIRQMRKRSTVLTCQCALVLSPAQDRGPA